jgi:hypothetical protein
MPFRSVHRQSTLPDGRFRKNRHSFKINDIQLRSPQPASYSNYDVLPVDIPREALGESLLSPTFRLVEMHQNGLHEIFADAQSFLDLLAGFHIDSEVHHLIQYHVHGFYHFPAGGSHPEDQTYYINTVSHTVVWSFNAGKKTTRAVLMSSGGEEQRKALFKCFRDFLEKNKTLAGDIMFLPMACVMETIDWVHLHLKYLLDDIREIEARFGYSTWVSQELRDLEGIEVAELTEHTQKIGSFVVEISDLQRRLKMTMLVLETVPEMML